MNKSNWSYWYIQRERERCLVSYCFCIIGTCPIKVWPSGYFVLYSKNVQHSGCLLFLPLRTIDQTRKKWPNVTIILGKLCIEREEWEWKEEKEKRGERGILLLWVWWYSCSTWTSKWKTPREGDYCFWWELIPVSDCSGRDYAHCRFCSQWLRVLPFL